MSYVVDTLTGAGFHCFSDLASWKAWRAENEVMLAARWVIAQRLRDAHAGSRYDGWCDLCGSAVHFRVSDVPQLPGVWFYRDDAYCSSCGMMGRLRMGVLLLRQLMGAGRSAIYVNEQLSALYAWLLRNYADVVGSEYAPDPAAHPVMQKRLDWLLRDQRPQRLRHEDATALSYPDGRFSALMSFDVLEHVPDYHAALREFARVLRPDGIAIITAPFMDDTEQTRVRARHLPDGKLEHNLPPAYHGDPTVAGGEILCYQDFGWDILTAMREAGFREALTVTGWSLIGGLPSQMTAWVGRR